MKKIYVIIYKQDVDLYCSFKNNADSIAYYFDPTLTDYIEFKKCENINYIGRVGSFSSSVMQVDSRRCALDFENQIGELIRKYTKISNVVGWQHLTLRYFFLTYFWYFDLWNEISYKFPDGEINIFVLNNPQYLHQQSYLPAVLLMQHLSRIGRVYKAYLYGEVNYNQSDVLDVIGTQLEVGCDLLIHLPTILYDAKYVEEALFDLDSVVNIKSKHWDTNINKTSINIGFVGSDNHNFYDAKKLKEALMSIIDGILSKYFSTHDFRKRQVNLLVEMIDCQIINYYIIDHYFTINKPKKLLISDHDTGLHGPILRYCENEEIEIYVFPHSKFHSDNGFRTRKTNYLNHPIQRSITCFHGGAKPKSNLYYPKLKKSIASDFESKNIRAVGLMLNGLSEGGILTLNFEKYINGIKILSDWCTLNSLIMKIRCRPDMPIRGVLKVLLEQNKNIIIDSAEVQLNEFISAIDLCVMYDTPTSAAISVLDSSCPLINIVPGELDFWISGWINEDVVPFYDLDSGIVRLNQLLITHADFLKKQQTEYNYRNNKSKTLKAILFDSEI
jgi:hypothetical protein